MALPLLVRKAEGISPAAPPGPPRRYLRPARASASTGPERSTSRASTDSRTPHSVSYARCASDAPILAATPSRRYVSCGLFSSTKP